MDIQSYIFSHHNDVQLCSFLYNYFKRAALNNKRTYTVNDGGKNVISIFFSSLLLDNSSLEFWNFCFIQCLSQITNDRTGKKHGSSFLNWEIVAWWEQSRPAQFPSVLHSCLHDILLNFSTGDGSGDISFSIWVRFRNYVGTGLGLLYSDLEMESL